jgi:hypothetical protein
MTPGKEMMRSPIPSVRVREKSSEEETLYTQWSDSHDTAIVTLYPKDRFAFGPAAGPWNNARAIGQHERPSSDNLGRSGEPSLLSNLGRSGEPSLLSFGCVGKRERRPQRQRPRGAENSEVSPASQGFYSGTEPNGIRLTER